MPCGLALSLQLQSDGRPDCVRHMYCRNRAVAAAGHKNTASNRQGEVEFSTTNNQGIEAVCVVVADEADHNVRIRRFVHQETAWVQYLRYRTYEHLGLVAAEQKNALLLQPLRHIHFVDWRHWKVGEHRATPWRLAAGSPLMRPKDCSLRLVVQEESRRQGVAENHDIHTLSARNQERQCRAVPVVRQCKAVFVARQCRAVFVVNHCKAVLVVHHMLEHDLLPRQQQDLSPRPHRQEEVSFHGERLVLEREGLQDCMPLVCRRQLN